MGRGGFSLVWVAQAVFHIGGLLAEPLQSCPPTNLRERGDGERGQEDEEEPKAQPREYFTPRPWPS